MLRLAVIVLALVYCAAASAQNMQLPPATPSEIQLRMQLGETMVRLGMTQAELAAISKERDDLKAKQQPEPEKKGPDVK